MTKSNMKKIFTILSVIVLAFAFFVTCFAAENEKILTTYTEDLGNGISAVVTITQTDSFARSSKKHTISKSAHGVFRLSTAGTPRALLL